MIVSAYIKRITIPTYKAGEEQKNPMFLEKRVYQGSSGVVYPHPVIETVSNEPTDEEYTAVFLENEYLQIMILPEIGGRIQRAYDKIRKRDFIYYNHVIKPALVGLTGPWISGGIEFNWPQHHRPSTFSPVDFTIEENQDGSKTVWVNETEIMFRTKGMAGFTLYPGKAYLEIKGRLFNRSPFPQTFLWWANPAVKVNEHYQSVFPPDVYAVFDHGKRDVSDFPIATGTYYKVNYSPGTDISRYHNIPVPTSYMAIRSAYDFIGCYEHDTQAGMLHVADHHLSPGKKQWTWGNGDFGHAWDRNLTDKDGPYIEIMTGMFTDNQPDFSWLQPNAVKSFEQYFMPYASIGAVKNATRDVLLNMEADHHKIHIKVFATSVLDNAIIILLNEGKLVKKFVTTISPEQVFMDSYQHHEPVSLPGWKLSVCDANGEELVSWQPATGQSKELPTSATPARSPQEIEHIEDLFLNGLHLEQYRHATFNPIEYYEEALRRSPNDVRCNNAMGLLLLRRGQFEQAEPYFKKAIETLTSRNPNPYDGEPFYNLGWSLLMQQKKQEAYEMFYKATWNDAWQSAGFQALARIAASQGKNELALAHVNKSIIANYHSHTARHLKAILLRKLGRLNEALQLIHDSIAIDPFNYGCLYEQALIAEAMGKKSEAASQRNRLQTLMRNYVNNYLELSLDYAHAGCYQEAIQLLRDYIDITPATPMVLYYLGWYALQDNNSTAAKDYFQQASQKDPSCCFPNKIEESVMLRKVLAINPADALAAYALGNFWYDKRQYHEAVQCWEQSLKANPHFPTVYRNLALAYYNKLHDQQKAISLLEKAFELDTTDARVLMELDQLYKITGKAPAERLRLLEQYPLLIVQRDDLYLEKITILNSIGNLEEARALMASRRFHPWEGGEGKVVGQFRFCHIELAKQALLKNDAAEAIRLLQSLNTYPANLGEGKLYQALENDAHYLLGIAYAELGNEQEAVRFFNAATAGSSEPVSAIYYNDPQPDQIVYQALAWLQLGEQDRANDIFKKLIAFGEQHMNDKVKIDYFAVSLPDMLVFEIDLDRRNVIHCTYMMALGYMGLDNKEKAGELLNRILTLDNNHQGAVSFGRMLSFPDKKRVVSGASLPVS